MRKNLIQGVLGLGLAMLFAVNAQAGCGACGGCESGSGCVTESSGCDGGAGALVQAAQIALAIAVQCTLAMAAQACALKP